MERTEIKARHTILVPALILATLTASIIALFEAKKRSPEYMAALNRNKTLIIQIDKKEKIEKELQYKAIVTETTIRVMWSNAQDPDENPNYFLERKWQTAIDLSSGGE